MIYPLHSLSNVELLSDQFKCMSNKALLIYFKKPHKNLPDGTDGNYQKNYAQTASDQRFELGTSGIRIRRVCVLKIFFLLSHLEWHCFRS